VCGRYTLSNSDRQEIGLRFEVEVPPPLEPVLGRFNAAPGQEVLIVRSRQASGREALEARWGLVPSWAEDLKAGYRMINARSETVLESRAYGPLARRASSRCLIPADGFFEWTGPSRDGGPKRPVRFTVDGGSLFSMAGLVASREWEGAELTSCTILTTDADRVVAPVHDRMPVILANEAAEEAWITGTLDAGEIANLTRPLDPARVSSRMASPWLNRVGAAPEGPELLDPDWTGPGTLFG
jgi:putative SOS response-associated peptidase YedK